MARAQLKLAKIKDPYLQKTEVENLFIYEFLPDAPAEYVKVYMFGLMYAQNNQEMDIAKLSRIMRISEEDILEAWGYWAKKGLVNIAHSHDNKEYEIEYLSLIESLYARTTENVIEQNNAIDNEKADIYEEGEEDASAAISRVVNMEIQAIFAKYESLTGRMLSAEDARRIANTISTYAILPDIMSFAVEYCIGENRNSVNQIIRTAVDWAKEGCRNLIDVKEYIDKHSKRNSYYNTIFREMNFNRLPSIPDREMMDRWFDELGYSIKEVLEACKKTAGMRDPSLRYVNKILENQRLEQGGINLKTLKDKSDSIVAPVSKKILKEYYDYIRAEGEKVQNAHIDEVCEKIYDIRELYELENGINLELLGLNLGNDNTEKRQELRNQRKQIDADRRRLLQENGFEDDYLDRKYKCTICKDTGYTDDGKVCSCSEARAKEALAWNQARN